MQLEDILRNHGFDPSSLSQPEYQRAGVDHLIYLLRIPVTQALAQWEVLRQLVPQTGYWPVLGWEIFKKPPWQEEPVQQIIEGGHRVNVTQWFEQQGERGLQQEVKETRVDDKTSPRFSFRLHLRQFPYTLSPLVPCALLPTIQGWEAPAYLPVTENEWDPPAAVQVAVMKYWNERWGAEVVAMVSGAMEMRVLEPPTTWQEALELAKEYYLYSPDVVDQWLEGSLQALAGRLLNGHVWKFWWD